MVARAVITNWVSEGVIFRNFHFPGEQKVNIITIVALDPITKMPEEKVYAVKVELA
jgi:predicted molibdopterin-dependent oxidoreductase YjgC